MLYYGCRHEREDYLYRQELAQFQQEGVLTQLNVAFSRDQAEKVPSCQLTVVLGGEIRLETRSPLPGNGRGNGRGSHGKPQLLWVSCGSCDSSWGHGGSAPLTSPLFPARFTFSTC